MSDAIAKAGTFAALAVPEGDFGLQDIVTINMGGQGIDPNKLDRVKVPSGGNLAWEVIDENGEPEPRKELVGVIVGQFPTRVYYATEYTGGNESPDCSSQDGINGVPQESGLGYGGKCSSCPKSQWANGQKPECSQRKKLLLLEPDSILPLVIDVPPTSLDPVDKYLLRITKKKVLFFQCVTSLKLSKEKNKGGIEYARIAPGFVRVLDADERASAFAIYKGLSQAFSSASLEDEPPY
ncbi:MAG TPA: hypothetical protein VMW79_08020 [Anaerolineae bacterium]|nr:hypothetical protein [Anaerolineae bacterium]